MKINHKHFPCLFIMMICLFLIGGCTNPDQNEKANVEVAFSKRDAKVAIQETGAEEWNYVALGDCVNANFPKKYLEMLEDDLGIKINYQRWYVNADHSSALLERLKTNQALRDALKNADVITIEIPWHAFAVPCEFAMGLSTNGCEGLSPEACIAQAAEIYMADTDAILAEIVSLSDPSQTLIRSMDTYQFFVTEEKEAGLFEMINEHWRACNEHLILESAKYNIPTARVYDAFMGDTRMEDPADAGLVVRGNNLTPEGSRLIAEQFRKLGYFYAPEE